MTKVTRHVWIALMPTHRRLLALLFVASLPFNANAQSISPGIFQRNATPGVTRVPVSQGLNKDTGGKSVKYWSPSSGQIVIPRYANGTFHPAGGVEGGGPGSVVQANEKTEALPEAVRALIITQDYDKSIRQFQSQHPDDKVLPPVLQPFIRDVTLVGRDVKGDDYWSPGDVNDGGNPGVDKYNAILWRASGGLVENVNIFGFPGSAGVFARGCCPDDKCGPLRPFDNEKLKLWNINVGRCNRGIDIQVVDAVIGNYSAASVKEFGLKFTAGSTQIAGAIHTWGGEKGVWFARRRAVPGRAAVLRAGTNSARDRFQRQRSRARSTRIARRRPASGSTAPTTRSPRCASTPKTPSRSAFTSTTSTTRSSAAGIACRPGRRGSTSERGAGCTCGSATCTYRAAAGFDADRPARRAKEGLRSATIDVGLAAAAAGRESNCARQMEQASCGRTTRSPSRRHPTWQTAACRRSSICRTAGKARRHAKRRTSSRSTACGGIRRRMRVDGLGLRVKGLGFRISGLRKTRARLGLRCWDCRGGHSTLNTQLSTFRSSPCDARKSRSSAPATSARPPPIGAPPPSWATSCCLDIPRNRRHAQGQGLDLRQAGPIVGFDSEHHRHDQLRRHGRQRRRRHHGRHPAQARHEPRRSAWPPTPRS